MQRIIVLFWCGTGLGLIIRKLCNNLKAIKFQFHVRKLIKETIRRYVVVLKPVAPSYECTRLVHISMTHTLFTLICSKSKLPGMFLNVPDADILVIWTIRKCLIQVQSASVCLAGCPTITIYISPPVRDTYYDCSQSRQCNVVTFHEAPSFVYFINVPYLKCMQLSFPSSEVFVCVRTRSAVYVKLTVVFASYTVTV